VPATQSACRWYSSILLYPRLQATSWPEAPVLSDQSMCPQPSLVEPGMAAWEVNLAAMS
jgi:hypothetical protein